MTLARQRSTGFEMRFARVSFGLVTLALGCGQSGSSAGTSSASTASTATTASASGSPHASSAPPANEPPRAPPDDLDVAPLEKALACSAKSTTGPCRIIEAAKTCKGWAGISPGGDGRWVGTRYTLAEKKVSEDTVVLRARTVPSNDVGKGQIPSRIGIEPVQADEKMALELEHAVRALSHHDVPTKASPAITFIKQKSDFTEGTAIHTLTNKVVVLGASGDEQTFVCEGDGQELLVISAKSSGDGRYAELWPTSW